MPKAELKVGQVRLDPDVRMEGSRAVVVRELNTHSRFGKGAVHARCERGCREVRIKMSTLEKWPIKD